jgi:hypothetical protein
MDVYWLGTGFSQQQNVAAANGFVETISIIYKQYPFFFFITLFIFINAIWVWALFLAQTYNISHNITTNEKANWKRYSHFVDERGRFYNPYDKGILNNFREILCEYGLQETIDKTI